MLFFVECTGQTLPPKEKSIAPGSPINPPQHCSNMLGLTCWDFFQAFRIWTRHAAQAPPDVAKVSVVKAYGATIQVLGFSGRVCALISQRADIS